MPSTHLEAVALPALQPLRQQPQDVGDGEVLLLGADDAGADLLLEVLEDLRVGGWGRGAYQDGTYPLGTPESAEIKLEPARHSLATPKKRVKSGQKNGIWGGVGFSPPNFHSKKKTQPSRIWAFAPSWCQNDFAAFGFVG